MSNKCSQADIVHNSVNRTHAEQHTWINELIQTNKRLAASSLYMELTQWLSSQCDFSIELSHWQFYKTISITILWSYFRLQWPLYETISVTALWNNLRDCSMELFQWLLYRDISGFSDRSIELFQTSVTALWNNLSDCSIELFQWLLHSAISVTAL